MEAHCGNRTLTDSDMDGVREQGSVEGTVPMDCENSMPSSQEEVTFFFF